MNNVITIIRTTKKVRNVHTYEFQAIDETTGEVLTPICPNRWTLYSAMKDLTIFTEDAKLNFVLN